MKKLEEILNQKSLDSELEVRKLQEIREKELEIQRREERKLQEIKEKEIELEKNELIRQRQQQQNEINSKISKSFLTFGCCFIVALFSINIGIMNNDGGLFRGFFMQLLAIISSFVTVVYFIISIYYLIKRINN